MKRILCSLFVVATLNSCTRHAPKIVRDPGVVQGGHRDRLVRRRERRENYPAVFKIASKSARLKSQVFELRWGPRKDRSGKRRGSLAVPRGHRCPLAKSLLRDWSRIE